MTRLDGLTRTFALPVDWGLTAAGDDFLAWSDKNTLWILPAGSAQPIPLAQVTDEMGVLRFRANGSRLYWHTETPGGADTDTVMTVTCP